MPFLICVLALGVDDFFTLLLCDDFCFLNTLSTVSSLPKINVQHTKSTDLTNQLTYSTYPINVCIIIIFIS